MFIPLLKKVQHHIVSFFLNASQVKNKKVFIPAVAIFVLLGIFFIGRPTDAAWYDIFVNPIDTVAEVISNVLLWIAALLGKLLVVIIDILIGITQYNDFSTSDAVTRGWTVIRDISNMFFVLVLLVIAFGTIMKIESYKYGNLLPKLVIAAVLINFSKLIAGFFIDIGQVIMLTFVNAFADTAASNFTSVLKLKNMLDILPFEGQQASGGTPPSNSELVAVPFLAVMMLIVAIMTMLAMVVVFLVRIVALWILVVLSPLAYILSVLPGGASKYSGQWWSTFGKWVTTGPILAFFIWLSLAVLTTGGDLLGGADPAANSQIIGATGAGVAATISDVSSSRNIMGFMLAIAMMVISLSVASSLGGAAGAVAGNMAGKIKNMGSTTLKVAASPIKGATAGAKAAAKWGVKRADDWQSGVQQRFMANTRLGKWTAKTRLGQGLGLDKLQTKGIQFRSIPEAWRTRKGRLEEQRIGESKSVAEDILNRFYSRGKDRTDYTSISRAARASKAKPEVSAAGTEQEIIVARVLNEVIDSNGKVKPEKMAEAEASLEILLGNHDINELLKNEKIADIMNANRQAQGMEGVVAGRVSQRDLQGLLKHMFGPGGDTLRIAKKLEEKGLSAADGWIKGITKLDPKTGKLDWETSAGHEDWREDKAAEVAAFYMKKREGRRYSQALRRQDMFTERADQDGNISFRTLNNVGKWNLKENAETILKTKLEHVQGEFSDAFMDNLDLVVEWADDVRQQIDDYKSGRREELPELTEAELEKVDGVVGKFAAGELGYDEFKGGNKEAMRQKWLERIKKNTDGKHNDFVDASESEQESEAKRLAEEQYARRVLRAVRQRQTGTYWERVHGDGEGVGIATRRDHGRKDLDGVERPKWNEGDNYDPDGLDHQARNKVYTNSEDGTIHHYNARLDGLRQRAGIKKVRTRPRPEGGIKPSSEEDGKIFIEKGKIDSLASSLQQAEDQRAQYQQPGAAATAAEKQQIDDEIAAIRHEIGIRAYNQRQALEQQMQKAPSPEARKEYQEQIDELDAAVPQNDYAQETTRLHREREDLKRQQEEYDSGAKAGSDEEKRELADDIANNQRKIDMQERDRLVLALKDTTDEDERDDIIGKLDGIAARLQDPRVSDDAVSDDVFNSASVGESINGMEQAAENIRTSLESAAGGLKDFDQLSMTMTTALDDFTSALGQAAENMNESQKAEVEEFAKALDDMKQRAHGLGASADPREQKDMLWAMVQLTKQMKQRKQGIQKTASSPSGAKQATAAEDADSSEESEEKKPAGGSGNGGEDFPKGDFPSE